MSPSPTPEQYEPGGAGALDLVLTLTDEEISVVMGRVGVDLPVPSMGIYGAGEGAKAASRSAERSLLARGVCDGEGELLEDVTELFGGFRSESVAGERVLAGRTDYLRLARGSSNWVGDLITDDGFHQLVTGSGVTFADFLADWAVPIRCAFGSAPDVRFSRREMADDPDLLAQLGEVGVMTTLTSNLVSGQAISIYANVDHALRAESAGDDLTFTSVDRHELSSLVTALLDSCGEVASTPPN